MLGGKHSNSYTQLKDLPDNAPPRRRKNSLNLHVQSFFNIPKHTQQHNKMRELLLTPMRSFAPTKLSGHIRYQDQRFPEFTTEDFERVGFIAASIPALLQLFENKARLTVNKEFQELVLEQVVDFFMRVMDSEKIAVGAIYGHPSRIVNSAVKDILTPSMQHTGSLDSDFEISARSSDALKKKGHSRAWVVVSQLWARCFRKQNPNKPGNELDIESLVAQQPAAGVRSQAPRRQSKIGMTKNTSPPNAKNMHLATEVTSLVIPARLWEVQLVVEFLLRELEELDQLDMIGSWSPRVFLVNALTFGLEVLFNAVLVSGPAVVDLGATPHSEVQFDEKHIPLVNFLPLDVLLKIAHGTATIPTELECCIRLLVSYSQVWVCTVRNSVVFISTDQERAITNTGVVGRCLILDPITLAPVRDNSALEWHVIATSQGLRVVSPETLEGKEQKARSKLYNEWCPFKGYPSTLWLLIMLTLSWAVAIFYVRYPNPAVRPLAFPTATIFPMLLADEFGYLGWAIFGDFDTKISNSIWFMRSSVTLRCNRKTIHNIRPPFKMILRIKFVMRMMPLLWTLMLLWGGWSNLLPVGLPRDFSDMANFVVAIFCTLLLVIVWPKWGDLIPRPAAVVGLVGRCETELAPPRRFFRWSDAEGQFNVVPTMDGVLVFPQGERVFRA